MAVYYLVYTPEDYPGRRNKQKENSNQYISLEWLNSAQFAENIYIYI